MQVTCSCGKVLSVPETLAGKTVRCPACQKIFKVVGAATPPAAQPTRIQVECACGKKLSAPLIAAGKQIHCPSCDKELVVPAPRQSAPPPAEEPAPAPEKRPPAPASYAAAPGAPGSAPAKTVPPEEKELAFELDLPLADAPAPAAPPAPSRPQPAPPPKAATPPKPTTPVARSKTSSSAPPEDSPGGKTEKAEYGLSAPKCPNCQSELAMGSQFCVECGTALATGHKVKSVAAPPKKKSGSMGWLSGLFGGSSKGKDKASK